MKNESIFERDIANLTEYYFTFRSLVALHRNFNYGNAPRLSEGFTEKLCGTLFGFDKAENVNREYDLYDPVNHLKIEVKATSDEYGSTTINPHSKFDYLYWINFQLNLNCLWIKVITYKSLHKNLIYSKDDKRINITLSKIELLVEPKYYYFCQKTSNIVEMSVHEQIEYIKQHK